MYKNKVNKVCRKIKCVCVCEFWFYWIWRNDAAEILVWIVVTLHTLHKLQMRAWAPAGIWHGGTCPLPWKCCNVLFVLQMWYKGSLDEILMHYFEHLRKYQLVGASPKTLTVVLSLDLAGGLPSFRHPHCNPGKNPAGAHGWEPHNPLGSRKISFLH